MTTLVLYHTFNVCGYKLHLLFQDKQKGEANLSISGSTTMIDVLEEEYVFFCFQIGRM